MIMATFRGQGASSYDVGQRPPLVSWTVVKGDTASFRVYVTDDNKDPLLIIDWTIKMEIKRPNSLQATPFMTDDATPILTLFPAQSEFDGNGEFTVSLTSGESSLLNTGDIFDIELSQPGKVWTVAQGSMIILEDVTN
jgi:hypothetical protein